jgi:hypothetical protein
MKKFSIFLIFILSCAKSGTEKFWQDGNPLPYKASFSWIEKKSLDISLKNHTCSVLDNNIYVFGGQTSSKVFKYDPNSDNWSYVTDMKTPRKGLGSAVIGNEIYVFGGIDDNNNITNKVEIFKVSPIVF